MKIQLKKNNNKKTRAIEGRVKKQILGTDQKSVTNFFSKDFLNEETIYEMNKIKEGEQEINRSDLFYKIGDKIKTYDFQTFKKIRSFGKGISSGTLKLNDVLEEHIKVKGINKFKKSMKSKVPVKNEKKKNTNF